jgi:hypothetical protein
VHSRIPELSVTSCLYFSACLSSRRNCNSANIGVPDGHSRKSWFGGPPRTRTGTPFSARFSYHFGFRRPRRVRGLDCPFTIAAVAALGAARPVSTPSRSLGLGSGLAVKPSPTLSGSAPGVSAGAPNFSSESRASTNSARGPGGLHSMPIRSRQRRPFRRQSRCREPMKSTKSCSCSLCHFQRGLQVDRFAGRHAFLFIRQSRSG